MNTIGWKYIFPMGKISSDCPDVTHAVVLNNMVFIVARKYTLLFIGLLLVSQIKIFVLNDRGKTINFVRCSIC